MTVVMRKFGFCPEPIEVIAGPVKIRPLPKHDAIIKKVLECDQVRDGWIYAPPKEVLQSGSGKVFERPYRGRLFNLPETHTIEHANGVCEKHLDFLVWALSFFLGTRLTMTKMGFLDATPIESDKLVDFRLRRNNRKRGVELAEAFWTANSDQRNCAKLFAAAVHALFLGQYPQNLEFERFIYLYIAIDACFKLGKKLQNLKNSTPHFCRIKWMCKQFGLSLPDWAKQPGEGSTHVADIRNPTFHEGLLMDEPLGFAVHGQGVNVNLTLEMSALVCRMLVALIGGKSSYIASPVNTRQIQELELH